jgi:Recombination endonuclease VII
MPEKRCITCHIKKSYEDFPLSPKNSSHTRSPSCTDCTERKTAMRKKLQRNVYTLRQHGLTPEDYLAMRADQEDCCAICGRHESLLPHLVGIWKRLVIDHDHATGKIRGLLCQTCNHGLGAFADSIPTLRSAIRYLQGKHRAGTLGTPQIGLFETRTSQCPLPPAAVPVSAVPQSLPPPALPEQVSPMPRAKRPTDYSKLAKLLRAVKQAQKDT